MERKILYYDNPCFNNALVVNALADEVLRKGGYIQKPMYNVYTLYRRHVLEDIKETISRIEGVKLGNPTNVKYIEEQERKLKELESLSEAYNCDYSSYLRFIYDGNIYYFQMEENPFFENHYLKTPFAGFDEKVNRNYYLEQFDIWNCFEKANFDVFSYRMTKEAAKRLSEIIFDALINGKMSKQYNDKSRYEIYKKEDFTGGTEECYL